MAIDYDKLMALETKDEPFSYKDTQTMLYALGVGFGREPLNEKELAYVYEKDLKTVPTLSTVVAWGAGNMQKSGINYLMVVHGEQRLTMHRPLPVAADILADSRVTGVFDKGADKGALVLTQTTLRLKDSGEKLCTLGSTTFARGDGGFGGPKQGAPSPHVLPTRAPDTTCTVDTLADQALLYRLSGDRNPLHSDPEFAKAAGFPKPILHGLCTYGSVCRALITQVCDYDHTKIKQFDARFSAPVFPGDSIAVDIWKDGATVSFCARVAQRDTVVLNNGLCVLDA